MTTSVRVDIFASSPGQVTVFKPYGAAPMSLAVEGFTVSGSPYEQFNAILTGVGLRQAGSFQFTHTLRQMIYVYTFGDRIGDLTLNGMCFLNPCQGVSGFESVYQYYANNRMAERGTPVVIAIGAAIVLRGFLGEISLTAQDPMTAVGQFALQFHYVPSFVKKTDNLFSGPAITPSGTALDSPTSSIIA